MNPKNAGAGKGAKIYHLALGSELEGGCEAGFYAPPRLGEDGFVHCAPADLVLQVADDYLADSAEPVWLLELEPEALSAGVVWEAPAPIAGGGSDHRVPGRTFPHVYGPIELAAISGAGRLERTPEGFAWPDQLAPFEHPAGPRAGTSAETALARTRATYDRVARRFMTKNEDRSGLEPWMDRLVARLPAAARVLDAGGGPGQDSALLRRRGLRTVCADLSLGMLREGAKSLGGQRVQADLRGLPFADDGFDAVWANASLLHLDPPDMDRALAELHRVLAPGGPAHVCVKLGEGAAWDLERFGEPRWFQYWTAEPFDARLQAAGFEILVAETNEGKHADWLVRLLRAR